MLVLFGGMVIVGTYAISNEQITKPSKSNNEHMSGGNNQRRVVSLKEMLDAADTNNRAVSNLVPAVGNEGNPNKAWNDTPTIGMLAGVAGTEAPASAHDPTATTPVPGGLPVTGPLFCPVPTGYLQAIVNAWNKGFHTGMVHSDGVVVDMGHEGGAFYDTTGNGCCDTYCRRVVKGGWWSCVDPYMVGTQYDAGIPRGIKCEAYGKRPR